MPGMVLMALSDEAVTNPLSLLRFALSLQTASAAVSARQCADGEF
jgi:hypothetical protein